jgi:hypothetical protein
LMCERRSNVAGSIVWYSSSMPRVNEGFIRTDQLSVISFQFKTARLLEVTRILVLN